MGAPQELWCRTLLILNEIAMMPKNQSRSLREFATTLPASKAAREALERYERTGSFQADDLRKILGDPSAGVEFGPGVVHKRLEADSKA